MIPGFTRLVLRYIIIYTSSAIVVAVGGKQLPWETIPILQVHFISPTADQSGLKPDGSIFQK